MSVTLSPLAGAGWQFFTNDGAVLTGGLLYTYAAGTTTPATTYTSSSGVTANSNPIVLDSAGRVPYEIWLTDGVFYKFVLRDSTNSLIGTYDNISNSSILQDLANTTDVAKGDALVGFRQSNSSGLLPYSVGQTVHRKLQETVSVFDFMTQAQINDVQGGTYGLDVTTACQKALDSGATRVVFPEGSYKIAGLTIGSTNPNLQYIDGKGTVKVKVTAATNAVGFSVAASRPFVNFDNLYLISSGSSSDGFTTYGILFVGSNAHTTAKNIRADGFSGAGMEWRQTVYTGIENYVCNGCRYGVSFQYYSAVPTAVNTTVVIDRAYISNCTRGVFQGNGVGMEYRDVVTEYCGSSTTNDGAFHIASGQCQLIYPYGEANARNIVATDAEFNIQNQYFLTATAPDVITYSAIPFSERGIVTVLPYRINTPRIGADTMTGRDCVVGENLTVPVAGGSVIFGNETMYSASGTLTNATWTTVYTIPTAELSGTSVNLHALYEYTCYAGAADLSTGFDAGTIFNSTLRSYSGTTPAWLRLSGNLVQMNVTSTSYGLGFKIVMRRVYPG